MSPSTRRCTACQSGWACPRADVSWIQMMSWSAVLTPCLTYVCNAIPSRQEPADIMHGDAETRLLPARRAMAKGSMAP